MKNRCAECGILGAAFAGWFALGTANAADAPPPGAEVTTAPVAPSAAAPISTEAAPSVADDAATVDASAAAQAAPSVAPAPVADKKSTVTSGEPSKKKGEEEPVEEDPFIDGIDAQVRARVMAGWQYKAEHPVDIQTLPGAGVSAQPEQKFFLRQARVRLKMRYKKRLGAKVSFELTDELNLLRDAYIDARVARWARFRLGRFKRPFSRLELTGVGSLPVRGRGYSNGYVIEDAGWASRGVGLMYFGGRQDKLVEWFLSATAPDVGIPGSNSREGIDVHARLESEPLDSLAVGLSGGYKNQERPPTVPASADVPGRSQLLAFGGDARFKLGGLRVVADAYLAQTYLSASNLVARGEYFAGGVVGYATYNFDLPKKFQLQPVVLGEWADRNLSQFGNENSRFVVGLNVLWSKWLRIMPQLQIERPAGIVGLASVTPMNERSILLTNSEPARETFYVMASAQY